MSTTEFCCSRTFLPDDTSLSLTAQDHWRGTPWSNTKRAPVRAAIARRLHWDSTPDFDFNFTDTEGPRQCKAKYGAIGSGRPTPGRLQPQRPMLVFGASSRTPDLNQNRSKVSFDLEAQYFTQSADDQTAKSRAKARVLRQRMSKYGATGSGRPKPDLTPQPRWPKFVFDASSHTLGLNQNRSKVSFDLEAQYPTQSTDDQTIRFRARAHEHVEAEAIVFKRMQRFLEEEEQVQRGRVR